jgi:hypothetical protein
MIDEGLTENQLELLLLFNAAQLIIVFDWTVGDKNSRLNWLPRGWKDQLYKGPPSNNETYLGEGW